VPRAGGKDQLEKRIADPDFVIDPAAAVDPTLNDLLQIRARIRHPLFDLALPTFRL